MSIFLDLDKYDLIWIGVIVLIIFTFGFIAGYAIKGCPVDLSCNKWNLYNQNFSSLFCNCTRTNTSIENQWYFKSYNITECQSASDCANINNTAIGCIKIDCNWCCFKKHGMSTCTLMLCDYYQGD
jgi:hypothetical protein